MKKLLAALALTLAMSGPGSTLDGKPTVVLVHGAFADSSSWNGVVEILEKDGYPVVSVANPLRGVSADGGYVGDVLADIAAPIVLVGHSYGGSVISHAAAGRSNVKALVYAAAAPETDETAVGLSGRFPGSTLGSTLAPPVLLSDGGKDLYIQQDKFSEQFAADVSDAEARLMAVAQRPIAEAALNEPQVAAAWKEIPSWFIYGSMDKNIPPEALAFMAARAKSKSTVVVEGASHVVMVSHPEAVAKLIENAATAE